MYALVEIKGKQYKVSKGDKIQVDKIEFDAPTPYVIDKVLALVDGENAKFGTPYVEGASVKATVGEEVKGDKVKIYKFHRRKGYRRTQGHRQQYTLITIDSIEG